MEATGRREGWLDPHWLRNRRRREPWKSSTVGRKKKGIRGVKIIRAQKYAGVDNDRQYNRDLVRLCERVNAAALQLPDGRRLLFQVHDMPCPVLHVQKRQVA